MGCLIGAFKLANVVQLARIAPKVAETGAFSVIRRKMVLVLVDIITP